MFRSLVEAPPLRCPTGPFRSQEIDQRLAGPELREPDLVLALLDPAAEGSACRPTLAPAQAVHGLEQAPCAAGARAEHGLAQLSHLTQDGSGAAKQPA